MEILNPVSLKVRLAMREAPRNAIRHSGCLRMGIELEVSDGKVRRRVMDNGGALSLRQASG